VANSPPHLFDSCSMCFTHIVSYKIYRISCALHSLWTE